MKNAIIFLTIVDIIAAIAIIKEKDEIMEVKKEMSRLRREVDAMRPFICSRPSCDKRMFIDFSKEGQPC